MPGFADFARHLATRLPAVEAAQRVALAVIAEKIEERAKAKIGDYQAQSGPFPGWAPLAESTVYDKTRKGYAPPDSPLLRTGDLRASYAHSLDGLQAVIGSPLQLAVWQELGTQHIPPRPVVGPAAFEMRDSILKGVIYATLHGFKG